MIENSLWDALNFSQNGQWYSRMNLNLDKNKKTLWDPSWWNTGNVTCKYKNSCRDFFTCGGGSGAGPPGEHQSWHLGTCWASYSLVQQGLLCKLAPPKGWKPKKYRLVVHFLPINSYLRRPGYPNEESLQLLKNIHPYSKNVVVFYSTLDFHKISIP